MALSNICFFFFLSCFAIALVCLSFVYCWRTHHHHTLVAQKGEWAFLHENIGISAMHMQLLHNQKVIMFDRTDFGPSNLSLPNGHCRFDPSDIALQLDCTAHSILYDLSSNTFRPLMVQTDTWCSSGAILPNGTLIQTGGFNDGDHVVRSFTPCADNMCDWIELPSYLAERRWYATNQILPDGRVIIIGGRRQFNYEFYPKDLRESPLFPPQAFQLGLLRETTDRYENNLYPFVHLLPDGHLFIFANTRSILFDYDRNAVVKEFPPIPGGDPRNYPSSGSSVLLPIDENKPNIEVEVMICGGAPVASFSQAENKTYLPALKSCGRLKVTDQEPNWVMEDMPRNRVMGDMLILPSGDIIIINGAELGSAGWENGQNPVLEPLIYTLSQPQNQQFLVMSPAARPRLYHSSAILLPDGRVLVGGSNPHVYYNFTGVQFPTELSLEAFSPPYLSPEFSQLRPKILSLNERLSYRESFNVTFSVPLSLTKSFSVRIVAPSFTTHSFAMNQRMVVLKMSKTSCLGADLYNVTAVGPSTPEIAPPGYYLLFVVNSGIPSCGAWVKLQ